MIDYRHGLLNDVPRTHLILAMSIFFKGMILKQSVHSIGLIEVAWRKY